MLFPQRKLLNQKPICPITKVEIQHPICVISRNENNQTHEHYFESDAFFKYASIVDYAVANRPVYNPVDGSVIITIDEAAALRKQLYLDTWDVCELLALGPRVREFNREQTKRRNLPEQPPAPLLVDLQNIINAMPQSRSDL